FEVVCERRLYTVAVSGEPSEGGTVSGGGSVAYGDDATVGYAPAEGWHVETLTVDGVPWPPASYPAGLTLRKVGTNHQVEVGFRRSMYPFALTVSDEAGGTVSGPTLVEHGRDATVAWEAAPGWQVTAVTVDGASRAPAEFGDAGAGRLVFEKTDGPHRVHVTVEKRTYAVTAVVAAGNGAVSPGEAKVVHGEPAAVTWRPLPGWRTATVTVDGVALGEAEAASGRWECPSVEAPHRVAVTFQRQSFLIETFADRTLGRLTASAEVPYQDDFPVRWSPGRTRLWQGQPWTALRGRQAALAAGSTCSKAWTRHTLRRGVRAHPREGARGPDHVGRGGGLRGGHRGARLRARDGRGPRVEGGRGLGAVVGHAHRDR
ncbi:MAG: InlB B-repeat-containing protein, partial [Adlercreutzia sp.]